MGSREILEVLGEGRKKEEGGGGRRRLLGTPDRGTSSRVGRGGNSATGGEDYSGTGVLRSVTRRMTGSKRCAVWAHVFNQAWRDMKS